MPCTGGGRQVESGVRDAEEEAVRARIQKVSETFM
jgi:hypothetical protein